jgi:putative membrane protein
MLIPLSQTPLPVIFGVHLKQTVTLFLCILPFTLVDVMGWKMVVIVTCCAFTMMGVEHIAAQVEMPFGTDPGDLNLDLFCTELLCECK